MTKITKNRWTCGNWHPPGAVDSVTTSVSRKHAGAWFADLIELSSRKDGIPFVRTEEYVGGPNSWKLSG